MTLDSGGSHLNRTTTYAYTAQRHLLRTPTTAQTQIGTETGLLSVSDSVADPLGHTGLVFGDLCVLNDESHSYVTEPTTVWVSTVTEPAGVIPNTGGTTRTLTWDIMPVRGTGRADYAGDYTRSTRSDHRATRTSGLPARWTVDAQLRDPCRPYGSVDQTVRTCS